MLFCKNGVFEGLLQVSQEDEVPEHVAQLESQSASGISVFISAELFSESLLSSEATASPSDVTMSIWNAPVLPVVEGLTSKPKSIPN